MSINNRMFFILLNKTFVFIPENLINMLIYV
ncbi:hypothetical protein BACCIP111899_01562 [Bacillus rhizoplanae]|uniref:Uncharacterized protein n=1 Tax=Bacillus rhizoplanae TaxID=2880966 RepID=A0ABN7ZTV2_9BACI|nr:hypothetical protein BACCIP111899_01562 [Bacillus rhizoplanae]